MGKRTFSGTARRGGPTLVLLGLARLVTSFDVTVVGLALPTIGREFGLSTGDLQWVMTAYVLAFGGFLLLGGRVGDLFGHRRVFLAGFVAFALASLVGGLAFAPWVLLAARVCQGIAAALLAPVALALLTRAFEESPERDRAIGLYAAMGAAGFAGGVVLGGLLVQLLSWRWVLWVNVPIALTALLAAPALLPGHVATREARSLDLPGAVTVTSDLAALIYALTGAEGGDWASPRVLGFAALGLALLATFLVIELRSPAPLVPPSFLRERRIAAANAAVFLVSTTGTSSAFVVMLYFQRVLGLTPIESGLSYLPAAAGAVVGGVVAGRVVGRIGEVRPLGVVGLAVVAVGLLLMTGMVPGPTGYALFVVGTVLSALGFDMGQTTMTIAGTSGAGGDRRGLAAGVLNTAMELGGAWGLGAVAAVVAIRTEALGGEGPEALMSGLRWGLLTGVVFVGLALPVVWWGLRGAAER